MCVQYNNNNNTPLPPFNSIPAYVTGVFAGIGHAPCEGGNEWFDPLGISRVRGETSLNPYPLDTGT
jgi:hypothetical protein